MLRQTFIGVIIAKLKTIKKAEGFNSDIGESVFEWRNNSFDPSELPALVLRDPDDTTEDDLQTLQHALKIEIDIVSSNEKIEEVSKDIREIVSDILKAFGEFEADINQKCKYLGSETLFEHKDVVYGGIRTSFVIEYPTKRWEQ